MVPVSLSSIICTVKFLALHIALNLDFVIDFLKLFPCVEKLYIMVTISYLFLCCITNGFVPLYYALEHYKLNLMLNLNCPFLTRLFFNLLLAFRQGIFENRGRRQSLEWFHLHLKVIQVINYVGVGIC